MTTNTATAKQIEFINRLKIERACPEAEGLLASSRTLWSEGLFTPSAASKVIDGLLDLPLAPADGAQTVEDGLYALGSTLVKVQTSPTTGRKYTKMFKAEDEVWVYSGTGPLFDLKPEQALTAEKAAEFGHLYGQCVACGRTLTDEGSVARGIGPICAGKNGW